MITKQLVSVVSRAALATANAADKAAAFASVSPTYRPPGCLSALLFVPGPTLPSLDGLALEGLLLYAAEPVVTPFFMLWRVVTLWRVVAPGPTLPSLEAPGAGCV